MGFFDGITQVFDRVAVPHIADSVEEIQRKIREEAAKAAEQMAQGVLGQVTDTAESMSRELQELLPTFDDKLQQVIGEITELASSTAGEGIDVIEAVNAAVEIAVKKVEDVKRATINAVKEFIDKAQDKLFSLLRGVLPGVLQFSIDKVKDKAKFAINNLVAIGVKLADKGISFGLQKIKTLV